MIAARGTATTTVALFYDTPSDGAMRPTSSSVAFKLNQAGGRVTPGVRRFGMCPIV